MLEKGNHAPYVATQVEVFWNMCCHPESVTQVDICTFLYNACNDAGDKSPERLLRLNLMKMHTSQTCSSGSPRARCSIEI